MPLIRVRLILVIVVEAICLVAGGIHAPAKSETVPQPRQVGPDGVVLGEKCTRRTDNIEGIVKTDACGRWYCGRIDVNDITVLSPRFADLMGCKWTLIDSKCKCQKTR
jgi:hypothetical protein